jgi:hypothetical protein
VVQAHEVVLAAERAEAALSYSSKCKSEQMRKLTGAYYTPADVAQHFWSIFFERRRIFTAEDAKGLILECRFIEPAVGAGALFFSLIEKLLSLGLSPKVLSVMRADLIDINSQALEFVRLQINVLESKWGIRFRGIQLLNKDFFCYDLRRRRGTPVFFGNPPFVANEKNASKWKNSFADFLEHSLLLPRTSAHFHFILPLSILFSRDYVKLRRMLRDSKLELSASSYDNIPDTLFKAGKPKNTNTNKANSQRCTILSAVPTQKTRIFSSKLHRWTKAERLSLLASVPAFEDVTLYTHDDQILRPANPLIASYLRSASSERHLDSFIGTSERLRLFVAPVARNYIGVRDTNAENCNVFCFDNEENFLVALGIISSKLFFDYWLSVGDGFHLTKSNILSFPVTDQLYETVKLHRDEVRNYWQHRRHFEKVKMNNGKETRSFDFSEVAPRLLDL